MDRGTNALGSTPQPADVTIRLTPDGMVPLNVVVPIGGRVRVINDDTRDHFLASDPHPGHFVCLPMEPIAVLAPGQRAVSGRFLIQEDCPLHDHIDFSDLGFLGPSRSVRSNWGRRRRDRLSV